MTQSIADDARLDGQNAMLHGFPAEPKSRRQWVAWRYVARDDKPTKVPVNPRTGHNADSTAPDTWGSFDEAISRAEDDGLDGVGFVFTEDDPYCGVDLDKCRDPETGDVEAWAAGIAEQLDSYSEVSPSGTGLHIVCKGNAPGGRNRKGGVEVYDRGRFFTVTGDRVPDTPPTAKDRHLALEGLYRRVFGTEGTGATPDAAGALRAYSTALTDEEVLLRCRTARNGDRFRALYDHGDASAYNYDDSAADAALVNLLAFYSGPDPERIETIMRDSEAAYRPKWDERRAGKSWLRYDIERALLSRQQRGDDYYTPKTAATEDEAPTPNRPALRAVSFADVPLPGPTRWIVEGLIPEDHQSTIYGEGGKGKSLLALHLGMSVALRGVDWWLGRLIQTAPVLFLDFELDRDTQARRVYDLAAGMGLNGPPAGLHYISALGYTTAEAIAAAAETVKELGVKLVIVDSVGMALEGDAEASKDVIAFYRNSVNALRAAGATPLLVDHQAKKQNGGDKYGNKTEFGSVYKRNNTRSSIQVDSTNDAGVFTMTVTHQKANLGPKQPAFTARMVFEPGKITVTHEALTPGQLVDAAPNARQKVLKALEAAMVPMYPTEIADATGLTVGTAKNKITELRKEGRVVDTGTKDDNGAVQVRLTEPPL